MQLRHAIESLLLVTTLVLANSGWAKTAAQYAQEMGLDPNLSYQATRVMETKDGRFEFKERIAPQKRAVIMDMGGMQGTMVTREDENRAFFTMPTMGMYRDMKLSDAMKQSSQTMDMRNVETVGRESIDGWEATKYKTNFKDAQGKGAGFIWVADEGFAIKMDMIYASRGMKGQRMTLSLKDITIGPQDPNHFEIPAGLRPMGIASMMGQVNKARSASGTQQANQRPGEENPAVDSNAPGFGDELGDAAKDETKDSVVRETRDSIRKGIRGLFRR